MAVRDEIIRQIEYRLGGVAFAIAKIQFILR
jgi:hypothetical protein